jgi:hypothetical protein
VWVTSAYLQLVFPLFGHLGEQLGLLPCQRIDQGVTLSHQAGFVVQSVFLGKQGALVRDPDLQQVLQLGRPTAFCAAGKLGRGKGSCESQHICTTVVL